MGRLLCKQHDMVVYSCRCPKKHNPVSCPTELRAEHEAKLVEIEQYLKDLETQHQRVIDSITEL